MDLFGYMQERGGRLPEHEAKPSPTGITDHTYTSHAHIDIVLLQQVLAALAELHSNGVVHRDIKTENILVETGSNPPRVWVNDLGCGYFPREGPYTEFRAQAGLKILPPPHTVKSGTCRGGYGVGQLTVWQVGVMLYVMLTGRFKTVTHNCNRLNTPPPSPPLTMVARKVPVRYFQNDVFIYDSIE
ncbi:Serine/threonine-protein kinase pim-2 [Merluccius polli]|uniref:Serine/threonine-protein kinase 1 n=1 Tax=Merluccius polli TaxID=89951 RepID=A0AA47MJ37_MERPO|nr:Serine/threonine-protein kinase pim-2 [Merluccius polli]